MKRASALALVLIVMVIVGLGTTAILQAFISYSQMKVISSREMKAHYLTEAGMQHAIWQCKNGNFSSPVTISTEEWPITITKTGQPDGSYEIQVTVQYPGM